MAFLDASKSKLYMAEFDLSTFVTEGNLATARALREATTWADSGSKFHPGTNQDTLSIRMLYDDGTSGSEVIGNSLRSATAVKVVTVLPDPTLGKQGYTSGDGWSEGPEIGSRVGSLVELSATLQLALTDRVKSLGPLASKTATFNGTSIDDTDPTAAGGKWVYHITTFAASGGNARWQIVLQDSANNSSFATVGSESVNITAVGAARRTFAGALRQYVRIRVVLDASSGTLEFIAAYERN
jgi:hypothetical protein